MLPFGTEYYAMEELIAEVGSAFLCRFTGILPDEIKNTIAFLANWLTVFSKSLKIFKDVLWCKFN